MILMYKEINNLNISKGDWERTLCIASSLIKRLNYSGIIETEDLEQDVIELLLDLCKNKYKPIGKFSTFAYPRICGFIKNKLRYTKVRKRETPISAYNTYVDDCANVQYVESLFGYTDNNAEQSLTNYFNRKLIKRACRVFTPMQLKDLMDPKSSPQRRQGLIKILKRNLRRYKKDEE